MRDFNLFKLLKAFKWSLSLFFLVSFTFFTEPAALFAADPVMKDYCIMPPYVKTDVEPNVLILFDNSDNMKNAAYDLNNDGVLDAYDSTKHYVGYFVYNQWYSYISNQFVPDDGTTYDPNSDSAAGAFYGNLLNWAMTSKFDLLESILVGGKSVNPFSNPNTLKGESNSWTGTYSSCVFNVDGGNLEITETVLDACVLIRTPRVQLSSLENIHFAQNSGVRSMNVDKQVYEEGSVISKKPSGENAGFISSISNALIKKFGASVAYIMDLLASDAEAVAPLRITTNSVSNGTVCQLYAHQVQATSGTIPYHWDISAGTLPSGLQICPGTADCTYTLGSTTYTYVPGTIYGIPTTAGDSSFTVRVTDNVGATDTRAYSVTIGAIAPLVVSTGTLPDATIGSAYSASLIAGGGCAPYTWSITGSLPTDFTLTAATGVISAPSTFTAPIANYSFTVTVTDSLGGTSSQALSILVKVGTVRAENFNAWVCVGTYANNCACAGCTPVKEGIVDLFLDQARFGLESFKEVGGIISPEIPSGTCVSPDQSQNFKTAIQNVNPVGSVTSFTPLVTALSYTTLTSEADTGAITYFINNNTDNCNPFRDASECLKNFVLMITSGQGANTGTNVLSANDAGNCSTNANYSLSKNACYGYANDLRNNPTLGYNDLGGKQFVSTYIVDTMGGATCIAGPPAVLCSTILSEAANKSGGTYYPVTDPTTLRDKLIKAFEDIIKRAAAGTAASVLASGEGSGANLIQAIFYPRKKFKNTDPVTLVNTDDEIDWIGRLTNLWYYVDPYFSLSNIRADGGDKILNLETDAAGTLADKDYIISLYYDPVAETTKARRWTDTDGDGVVDTQLADVEFENVGNLWEAGLELWKRDMSTTPRTLYTPLLTGGTQVGTTGLMLFPRWDGSAMTPTDNVTALFDNASSINYFDLPSTDRDGDGSTDGDLDGDLVAPNADADDANVLMRYVHGEDFSGLRERAVEIDHNVDNDTLDQVDLNGDGDTTDSGEDETVKRVWKLGDILNSTPKISSWLPLNSYQKVYKDTTYGVADQDPSLSDAADSTHFITTASYKSRAMVFAGANDGMLHAFKLGTLGLKWTSQTTTQKATLGKHCETTTYKPCVVQTDCPGIENCITDSDLGKEMWAFIPKNVLPYLKYLTDTGYCHVYSVDLTPYVIDASINIDTDLNNDLTNDQPIADCRNASYSDYWKCDKSPESWRTILIGGMRYGGACKDATDSCTTDLTGDVLHQDNSYVSGSEHSADCVKTPKTGIGLSSYFALDVTDQNNPKLLWEFSNPALGFTTGGPAVVRINARELNGDSTASIADDGTNGRWFVVFGSGPTGPIDTAQRQFLGASDQNLRLFILDLKTGTLARTITMDAPATPDIDYGFAGSMLSSTHDADLDYQDDVLYVPYVKKASATDTWTDGGVLRLITKEDLSGITLDGSGACSSSMTALNPNCWAVSTVMDGIGPVTSSVVKLQNLKTNALWLFFGTGRYYYELDTADDATSQRNLFGITDPCYAGSAFTYDASSAIGTACTDSRTTSDLSEVNLSTTAGVTNEQEGWFIDLDMCTDASGTEFACTNAAAVYRTERLITDPLATSSGVVFFTTYKPYKDQCSLGGKSFIWALKYDTAAAAGTLLKGKAIVQVSTGSIEQLDLSSAFQDKGSRRSGSMEGVPPTAQGLSIVSTPPALKRVLHIRQR